MKKYNIKYTKDKGKRVARFRYKLANGKTRFLQAPSRIALEQKLENSHKGKVFTRLNLQEYSIDDAECLFKKHLIYKRSKGKTSQSCIEDYDSFYKTHIQKFFKDKDLRLLQSTDIKDFINELKSKNYKTKTIKKIFNHFKNIITYLADEKDFPNITNEKNYLKWIVEEEVDRHELDLDKWTFEVMQSLIYKINNPAIKLICMILLETAARPSEIRAIEKDDLLFLKSNSLAISINKAVKKHKKIGKTKTKRGNRIVEISASLKDKMVDYLNTLNPLQNKLFLNSKGKYICVEQIGRAIDNAFKKMDIDYQENPIPRKSYMFRHFRTTYFAAYGKFNNALELAHYIGDECVDFVDRTYIAPYKNKLRNKEFKENIIWKN